MFEDVPKCTFWRFGYRLQKRFHSNSPTSRGRSLALLPEGLSLHPRRVEHRTPLSRGGDPFDRDPRLTGPELPKLACAADEGPLWQARVNRVGGFCELIGVMDEPDLRTDTINHRTEVRRPSAGEDRESFERFYVAEYRSLTTLARVLSGSALHAEDIAQEAMLAAYRRWNYVGDLDLPRTWVRRVCANLATSRVRRQAAEARAILRLKRQIPREGSEVPRGPSLLGRGEESPPPPSPVRRTVLPIPVLST